MRLQITDYSKNADLADAIRRYHVLLQMTFQTTVYKIFETPDSQIYRFLAPPTPSPAQGPSDPKQATLAMQCQKCHTPFQVQANLGESQPLQEGNLPFPPDNKLNCPGCGIEIDLSDARRQIEVQSKKRVVA